MEAEPPTMNDVRTGALARIRARNAARLAGFPDRPAARRQRRARDEAEAATHPSGPTDCANPWHVRTGDHTHSGGCYSVGPLK